MGSKSTKKKLFWYVWLYVRRLEHIFCFLFPETITRIGTKIGQKSQRNWKTNIYVNTLHWSLLQPHVFISIAPKSQCNQIFSTSIPLKILFALTPNWYPVTPRSLLKLKIKPIRQTATQHVANKYSQNDSPQNIPTIGTKIGPKFDAFWTIVLRFLWINNNTGWIQRRE